MFKIRAPLRIAAVSALALALGLPVLAAEPQSPEGVKMGLRILASVYGDMDRKLASGLYDRLPHENQEFQEGSGALRDAIANEPAEFKQRVTAALESALSAAQRVADASKTHDKGQVQTALHGLASAMRKLNALFPTQLRSEPGTVAPPNHGGGAPAPSP